MPTTKEVKPGDGKIATDAIEVKIDPRAEWTEIFDEAWRINRDYFYDPNMHGADWKAARDEVRGVPARPDHAQRPQPRDAVDGQRADASATPPHVAGDVPCAEQDRARRPARRRLRGRERPLPVQEGLRRPELDPGAARAADRAGRRT